MMKDMKERIFKMKNEREYSEYKHSEYFRVNSFRIYRNDPDDPENFYERVSCDSLVKPFSIENGGGWCRSDRRSKGVLTLHPDTLEIECHTVSGGDPNFWDLINFIMADKDIRLMVKIYQQKGRTLPYYMRVREGMSGCVDVWINFVDPKTGLQTEGKYLGGYSCFEKTAGIRRLYIGDFVEMIAELGYARFDHHETSAKYEKPYFASEFGTAVSKLI